MYMNQLRRIVKIQSVIRSMIAVRRARKRNEEKRCMSPAPGSKPVNRFKPTMSKDEAAINIQKSTRSLHSWNALNFKNLEKILVLNFVIKKNYQVACKS